MFYQPLLKETEQVGEESQLGGGVGGGGEEDVRKVEGHGQSFSSSLCSSEAAQKHFQPQNYPVQMSGGLLCAVNHQTAHHCSQHQLTHLHLL